jgi:hypothetical protein
VERRRHRQRQRALGAHALEGDTGGIHRGLGAGDHGLLGIVEVDGLHHLAGGLRRLGAAGPHHLGLQPQDGGHGARAHRHGLLHGLGAQRTSGSASARVRPPAATSAVYSPSEWPAMAGRQPVSATQAR